NSRTDKQGEDDGELVKVESDLEQQHAGRDHEYSHQDNHEDMMGEYVFAELRALEVVEKDAARPQTRGLDLVGIGYCMERRSNLRPGIGADQMIVVPKKWQSKCGCEKRRPEQDQQSGQ